jgi:hypothetical protein
LRVKAPAASFARIPEAQQTMLAPEENMSLRILEPFVAAFRRPTYALPVDLFRVLVGLLTIAYFIHLIIQADDFSSPNGLIDHTLTRELFWYTKIGLFGPWMGVEAFRAVYLLAIAGAVALVVGYHVRAAAVMVFLIAVSAYRWNFLVIYVDDAIMHLALFWLILLPTGRTLVLAEWLNDREGAISRWKTQLVPGGAVRCFLFNLMLVYIVPGLWKSTSDMWREGTALYAVLQMPMSYAPEFWTPEFLPLLKLANWGALGLELLLPLLFLLPAHHPAKWPMLIAAVGFHLGIVFTLRIPYANIACIAAMVLVFRHEIMRAVASGVGIPRWHPDSPIAWRDRTALAFIVFLTLAVAGEARIPSWRYASRTVQQSAPEHTVDGRVGFMRSGHNMLYYPLWMIGIAQSYQLFDWIDDRNFQVRYTATERRANGTQVSLDPTEIIPNSLRGVLLQTYLLDVTWGRVPRSRATELKATLFTRYAARYCRSHPASGEVEVHAGVRRLSANRAGLQGSAERLMVFECHAGRSAVRYPEWAGSARRLAKGTH